MMKKILSITLALVMLLSMNGVITFATNVDSASDDSLKEISNENGGANLFGSVPSYNVGDYIYFGRYPQATTDTNIMEPIRWRILSKDSDKALLISDKILDNVSFTSSGAAELWASSDIHTWLNSTFYNKAFNNDEKVAIRQETIVTTNSVDTNDKVFLLSKDEANTLFASNSDRKAEGTAYAKEINNGGAKLFVDTNYCSQWWLRSNYGSTWSSINVVRAGGDCNILNQTPDCNFNGVRPAIYIDLTSSYFTANESNITWNVDGGSWVGSENTWRNVTKYKEGFQWLLPTGVSLKKDGYELAGWLINGSDTTNVIKTSITGDLTLKAVFREEGSRALTDRENAAFIVRDEWTSWVKSFTNELSALDKNATERIYKNMDYYDMQYRFTEKYKKVPEYLDEDGKPTQKLKDLIKEKRKEISGATNNACLCFTSVENGSTVQFKLNALDDSYVSIGISYDGVSFVPWAKNTPVTLNSGESIYVRNTKSRLSHGVTTFFNFQMTGKIEASGSVDSLINFGTVYDNCYRFLFRNQTALVKAPELPSTTTADNCYDEMFRGCTNLTTPPSILPAKEVKTNAYSHMFFGCTKLQSAPKISAQKIGYDGCEAMFARCSTLEVAPELPATNLSEICYASMFADCTSLKTPPPVLPAKVVPSNAYNGIFVGCTQLVESPIIKMAQVSSNGCYEMFADCSLLNKIYISDYKDPLDSTSFGEWVRGVQDTGTIYYGGTYTDSDFSQDRLPKDSTHHWTVVNA